MYLGKYFKKSKSINTGKSSFSRDASLLVLGSVMSVMASLFTSYFTGKEDRHKTIRQEVLQFNDQFAYDLGRRYNLTMAVLRDKNNGDSVSARKAKDSLMSSRYDWNMKIFAYRAKLNYYYDATLESDFAKEIYNPLVELSEIAGRDDMIIGAYTPEIKRLDAIRVTVAIFLEKMYSRSLGK